MLVVDLQECKVIVNYILHKPLKSYTTMQTITTVKTLKNYQFEV